MSMFKRAEWKSGLTYSQVCDQCKTVVTYMDDQLDFRPWYADGFVYCPHCNKPLRHRETYAINQSASTVVPEKESVPSNAQPLFCSQCGKKFGEADRFCSQCGNKR